MPTVMDPKMIKFFLIKNTEGKEIGCEIHANGSKFFVEFSQERFKGVRIGEYPSAPVHTQTRVPALLVGEE